MFNLGGLAVVVVFVLRVRVGEDDHFGGAETCARLGGGGFGLLLRDDIVRFDRGCHACEEGLKSRVKR